jgi:hypothetical protein
VRAQRQRCSAGIALVTATFLLVATNSLAEIPDKPRVKFNAADQAAARVVALRRADLDSPSSWKGGMRKPDLSEVECPNYNPKDSDLVLTGAASSHFTSSSPLGDLVTADSEVHVLQTAHMVLLDWRRSVLAPELIPCVRQHLEKEIGSTGKLISLSRVPFPQIARYAAAFRAVVNARVQGLTVRVTLESVLVGRSRTEITLNTSGLAQSTVHAETLRLARILIGRARS